MAVGFLAPWEGLENEAYIDALVKDRVVWTVCYGETDPKYAYAGAKYTDSQCKSMLYDRVESFYNRMAKVANVGSIPVSVQASMLELMYNVGDGAFKSSTMLKLANAGRYTDACSELTKWVKASGKTINGLVNRRNASYEMCIKDIEK